MAQQMLMKQFRELSKQSWLSVELHEDDVYNWDLALMIINPSSSYYRGYFKAQMTFPKDYPYKPPDFRFVHPLWHPNIYQDGRLCISILHAPGEDIMSGEEAGERWSPVQSVESVLLSIISLLDDAEISSPANVDASVQYRDHQDEFKKRVRQDVEASQKDVPEGFEIPTHESTKPPIEEKVDDDFWQDSDAEELDLDGDFDFDDDAANGSESDEALNNESEDDDDFDDDTETIENLAEPLTKGKGKSKQEDDAEMTDVE